MANALILSVLFAEKILYKKGSKTMIVLKPGSGGYGCPETIYEYKPFNNKGYLQVDCCNGNISNKNLFGFQVTKKTVDKQYQPRIIYLTLNEIRQLYKDPRSIWDNADRWCEDNDDKEEDNV